MVVNQSVAVAAHCINPDCPHPYPQGWGNNFCYSCGSSLRLKNCYIPFERLGVGGFAAIYAVWDISTQQERVLKVLLETSPKALDLFEQEASVLASLRHPGVPKVEADGYFQVIVGNSPQRLLPCLVMEKITGQTLEDILELHPQGCPEAWVLNWLRQAVDILRELHRRQIIHRDIKPSNLMLRYLHPQQLSQSLHPTVQVGRQKSGFSSGKIAKNRQLVLIDFGGAKQIGVGVGKLRLPNYQASSTRLFSPGYSPPEQMAGAVVGPGADFYALGMTCIHLLTGVYPPDLQDPVTGELRWRDRVVIHPAFADLLDDMIRPDVHQRPTSASNIRARILRIYRQKITLQYMAVLLMRFIIKVAKTCLKLLWAVLLFVWRVIFSIYWIVFQIARAFVCTILAMITGGLGAFAGAAVGFWLAYLSPMSVPINNFLTQKMPQIFPDSPIALKPEIIVFAGAGWATAWSLSHAGILGKCRDKWAGRIGILGYALGWLLWQGAAPDRGGLVGSCAIAVYFLTLGLGLRSHQPIYAIVAALGTGLCFSSLVTYNLLPTGNLHSLAEAFSRLDWSDAGISIAFFSILGIILGFWLGVSRYILVPFLRLLGWR